MVYRGTWVEPSSRVREGARVDVDSGYITGVFLIFDTLNGYRCLGSRNLGAPVVQIPVEGRRAIVAPPAKRRSKTWTNRALILRNVGIASNTKFRANVRAIILSSPNIRKFRMKDGHPRMPYQEASLTGDSRSSDKRPAGSHRISHGTMCWKLLLGACKEYENFRLRRNTVNHSFQPKFLYYDKSPDVYSAPELGSARQTGGMRPVSLAKNPLRQVAGSAELPPM